MGWFRSLREGRCIDAEGNPIPWWSYSFILFLQERLTPQMRVFEYGSGYSTLWLAKRVQEVTSIEISRRWYNEIKKRLPANARVELHEQYERGDAYGELVQRYANKFDVIVIDGRDRVRCAMNAIGALNSGGVLIWDDAQQAQMHEGREFLKSRGFKQLNFIGTGPQHHGAHCTTVFYREGNCLGL